MDRPIASHLPDADKGRINQSGKFKDAAREDECDEDEARWAKRMKKVVKAKPASEKPE